MYAENEDTSYHCAWCGDPPDENGSHGICPAHAEIMIVRGKLRRIPSYFERFKEGYFDEVLCEECNVC